MYSKAGLRPIYANSDGLDLILEVSTGLESRMLYSLLSTAKLTPLDHRDNEY